MARKSIVLYHPKLPGRSTTAPSERAARVLEKSGWTRTKPASAGKTAQ